MAGQLAAPTFFSQFHRTEVKEYWPCLELAVLGHSLDFRRTAFVRQREMDVVTPRLLENGFRAVMLCAA